MNPSTINAKLEIPIVMVMVTDMYWVLTLSQSLFQILSVQCQLIAFLQQLCKIDVITQFISVHVLLAAMSHVAQLASREAQAECLVPR